MILSKILRSKATTHTKNCLQLFSAGFLALSVVEGLVWISALLLTSCSSMRRVQTVPVETIKELTRTDTLYINTFHFDSTYVSHDLLTDRSKDTILIRETNTVMKYQVLKDTIERIKLEVRHDSIPYEVRITEIKDVKYIPPWCKWLSATGGIALLLLLITLYQKLKSIV